MGDCPGPGIVYPHLLRVSMQGDMRTPGKAGRVHGSKSISEYGLFPASDDGLGKGYRLVHGTFHRNARARGDWTTEREYTPG